MTDFHEPKPKKPNPYDVNKALHWAEQGFPISDTWESNELREIICQALELLPHYDKLYCFGTKENHEAVCRRQKEIFGYDK